MLNKQPLNSRQVIVSSLYEHYIATNKFIDFL